MSLMKSNLIHIVKKQYLYKLQGCSKFFLVMIIMQIVGMIFSICNIGSMSCTSNETLKLSLYGNTTIQILIFTIACGMGSAINLNLNEAKSVDFTFVSNRISSNLSSIAILVTYAAFGAVTFPLSACFIRIAKYLLIGGSNIIERDFYISPGELICSGGATFLYILLFSSAVYFAVVLVERSKAFIIALLALIVLLPRTELFNDIIIFYGSEHSFFMFMVKVLVTSILLFMASIIISNNVEVRK